MKKNKNRLISLVFLIPLLKKQILLLFISFILFSTLNAQTPQIWPAEISFNYEGGSSNDAVTIRKNASTSISVPEYVKDSRNESCAFIKSQSNHKIKVKFSSNNSNMNYLVKATVISGTGIGNVCEMFVAPCDLNKTLTIDLSGSIPASIGKRTFTWKWEATALPINSPYCPITCTSVNTTHTYYTLLSAPQAPMGTPWTEVLNKACSWASGETSEADVMHEIVQGLYWYTDFLYDINYGAPRYTSSTTQSFNLTKMLSEIGGSNIIVNCYDMGKAVKIFTTVLGCNSNYVFTSPFGYLNLITPIGRLWTNNPFYASMGTPAIMGEDDDYYDGRSAFGNHAFCMLGSIVYDACLKVDIDINPDAMPTWSSWATGWDWNTYKSKVIDNNPASYPGTPTGFSFSVY